MNYTGETYPPENPGSFSTGEPGLHNDARNVSDAERIVSVGLGALLMFNGIRKASREPLLSLVRLGVGYGLLFRGVSGFCPIYRKMNIDGTKTASVNIRTQLMVNKPKQEVYAFWRNLENLPRFMKHLSVVKQIDDKRSHWEVKIPEGNPIAIKWDAEIIKDEPGSFLSWQSLPGASIENAGKVEFRDALGSRGTELRIIISYRPPAGNIGSGVSKLLNPLFRKMVKDDVMNFKQFIEMRGTPGVEEFMK